MYIKFITLGCKTNLYESDAMAEMFKAAGHTIAEKEQLADVYVINTCTVTGTGAQKSRQHIRKAVKENPNAVIIVTGCYAQTEADKAAAIEGVDIVVGNNKKSEIVRLAENAVKGKKIRLTDNILKEHCFEELTVTKGQSRVRANIKIQDGCSNFCTYCIIPYARGPVRSRSLKNIITEAEELANHGFSEIVLTGIHIGSYGKDFDEDISLIDVLEKLDAIDKIERVRLGSLEPMHITDDFVNRAKKLKTLCPQFHLSLQSGCDETLKRMNRHYDSVQYFNAVKLLKENIPDVAITTDLMVGFAGETDEEFEKSLEFVKKIGFMQMHIFKYSIREGTVAAKYKNQVDERVKDERSHKMLEAAKIMKESFYKNYIGKEIDVLAEDKKGNLYNATSANYMNVQFESDKALSGNIVTVKAIKYENEVLVCELISQ